jgi:hypothetical protein
MEIKERQRCKLQNEVNVRDGDTLHVSVSEMTPQGRKVHQFEEKIGRSIVVDTIVTFDFKDCLGLKSGIGALFGKSENVDQNL